MKLADSQYMYKEVLASHPTKIYKSYKNIFHELILNLLQCLENVVPQILKLLDPETEPHQVVLDPVPGLFLVTLSPE